MKDLPGWVRWLLVGRFVNALGSMAWVFIPLYLVSDRGLSEGAAGSIAAVWGLGMIAGNLAGGSVGDRFGLRPTLALASLASAVGCLLVPLTPTAALPVVLALMGALGGVGRPVSFALVTSALPSEHRRQASAWMRAVNNAGTVLGPPLGGLLAVHHFGAIFVIDAVASLLMLGVVLFVVPTAARIPLPDGTPTRLLAALRQDPRFVLLLLTVVAADTAYRFAYSAVPWQLDALGAAPWIYGTTISLNCALIVLFEPWLAHRLRERAPERLIALGFLLVGVGLGGRRPLTGHRGRAGRRGRRDRGRDALQADRHRPRLRPRTRRHARPLPEPLRRGLHRRHRSSRHRSPVRSSS